MSDYPLCLPCAHRGRTRLATHAIEMLDSKELYICSTCKAAFPVQSVRLGYTTRLLPHWEEAARLNKTAEVSAVNRGSVRRD